MTRSLRDKDIAAYLQSLSEDQSGDEKENVFLENLDDSECYVSEISSSDNSVDDAPLVSEQRYQCRIPSIAANEHDMRSAGGILWKTCSQNSSTPGRLAAHNILVEHPGATHYAKQRIGAEFTTAWRLLIDDTILRHIQKCTQAEAHRQLGDTNWIMSLQELDKFISVLYARGACGCKNISVNDMWNKKWGVAFFPQTLSRDRFKEIMKYIRFDVREERSTRLKTDKFALVSYVWSRFIENCKSCYRPGENIAVDEQLFPTKARCKFTQYMANKPDKFGIKFWLCVDVKSKYLLNGFPYLGKDENRPHNIMLGEDIVMRLMEPFLNKGRNVTTDNFFTSVSLAERLLSKRTTLVGTVNKARRDVPPYVKKLKLNLHDHEVLKTENNKCLLTAYQAKRHKNVLLLSTLHDVVEIDEANIKRKPNTVTFYNSTKFGVDVVDQMARKYSTKSSSRRWPVQVFFNILDLAAINAWVLFQEVADKKIRRRDFILQLASELSHFEEQPQAVNMHPQVSHIHSIKRRHCHGTGCKNKTNKMCEICQKPLCGTCNKAKHFACAGCVLKAD